ncbi:phytanoyl-CoA dioxygenase family protein [Paeniglutamicibacter psychrophenolicus]|uniref:Ectoine hydroxylase-related dioxygenase (Phytanoyl-CoA dioxygenase family) n=1 Tax=Paeniglutamicibacter psychrophenolicus TaxID=257454 RepID=A0ABS4WJD3_9MICC|nr:phytanoyl-CoA dioxygenase family protein [Paeniglutamicibacter psychrophenolicus]MBP2376305.1 ectoine hydroxylase-related dioxygenase (phytanoyl-CoA dioxygenase family) [Paeniglutamicibacter psychrophenolicus]
MTTTSTSAGAARWFRTEDCNLEDFAQIVSTQTLIQDYPYADAVEQNVLIYGPRLHSYLDDPAERADVQAELARALTEGPGIVVFKGAFPDLGVVDRATGAFNRLIAAQKAAGVTGGDHFAKPGANDRVWGALDKLALAEPEVFAEYYSSDVLALVSEAWLGPNYQVTSQVNVVNPGGGAQRAHRDYHLGFMSAEQASAYPAHVHLLTPALTLQGAVAHCDMPLESGPTLYLPHSHKYAPGYVAFHREDFTEYFQANHVQLPLDKGDAAFFNPALFHGAGSNVSTDIKRMANLLQVSSAFGRAMETVDRTAMGKALYPVLLDLKAAGIPQAVLDNVISASAEGYAFPTNLDSDQPIGGLAPLSQADVVREHLGRDAAPEELNQALDAQGSRRMTEAK